MPVTWNVRELRMFNAMIPHVTIDETYKSYIFLYIFDNTAVFDFRSENVKIGHIQ